MEALGILTALGWFRLGGPATSMVREWFVTFTDDLAGLRIDDDFLVAVLLRVNLKWRCSTTAIAGHCPMAKCGANSALRRHDAGGGLAGRGVFAHDPEAHVEDLLVRLVREAEGRAAAHGAVVP